MMSYITTFGLIIGVASALLILIFFIAFLIKEIQEWQHNRRLVNERRLGNVVLGVKIPTKHNYYTVVAYVQSRPRGYAIVTIINKELVAKLPDQTNLIVIRQKDYFNKITMIGELKTAYRHYINDIKRECNEIDNDEY